MPVSVDPSTTNFPRPTQVAVYAKKTETGGRGGLHDHHLVLSDSLQPCNFDRLMQSDGDAMFRSVTERALPSSRLHDPTYAGH